MFYRITHGSNLHRIACSIEHHLKNQIYKSNNYSCRRADEEGLNVHMKTKHMADGQANRNCDKKTNVIHCGHFSLDGASSEISRDALREKSDTVKSA